MSRFDTACLLGWREKFEFPTRDGAPPIIIWAHHPTPEESVAALLDAGIDTRDDGEVRGVQGLGQAIQVANTYCALAQYCIDAAGNLEGWPDSPRSVRGNGLSAISPDAEASILGAADGDPYVLRIIYSRIGKHLHERTALTETEGNESEPLFSGDSPESSGGTKTAASSAESQPN